MERIEIIRGDITALRVDAIVNAANESLLGGGGVDGAIHRAAGPGLVAECRKLGGCRTGCSKITAAYNLPCRFVIHTVGPIWHGGTHNEPLLLKSCYETALGIAQERRLAALAFPAISCGVYGYPVEQACRVAVETVTRFLREHEHPSRVVFIDISEYVIECYARVLNQEPS